MKQIKLTQGQYTLVDGGNYNRLNQHKWYALKIRGTFYAVQQIPVGNGKQNSIYMHRQILGLEPGDSRQGDHINHNTLDNRGYNLRICTYQQNSFNQKSSLNFSSQYKGVSWNKRNKKWSVYIKIDGKKIHLGYYESEKEAALAYNEAAKKYFGEFACLNQI